MHAVPDPIAFLSQTSAKSRGTSLNAASANPATAGHIGHSRQCLAAPGGNTAMASSFGSPHVKVRLPGALTGGSALFLMLLGLAVVCLQVDLRLFIFKFMFLHCISEPNLTRFLYRDIHLLDRRTACGQSSMDHCICCGPLVK